MTTLSLRAGHAELPRERRDAHRMHARRHRLLMRPPVERRTPVIPPGDARKATQLHLMASTSENSCAGQAARALKGDVERTARRGYAPARRCASGVAVATVRSSGEGTNVAHDEQGEQARIALPTPRSTTVELSNRGLSTTTVQNATAGDAQGVRAHTEEQCAPQRNLYTRRSQWSGGEAANQLQLRNLMR